MTLIQSILVQFCKSSELNEKDVTLPTIFDDSSLYIPVDDVSIGNETKQLLADIPVVQHHSFLFKYRSFYKQVVQYLQRNLPLKNHFLKSLNFLSLEKPMDEKQTLYVASKLPTVVPPASMDDLRTEIRIFNLTDLSKNIADYLTEHDILSAWKLVPQLRNDGGLSFPLLCEMASAVCTLFHGNADPERHIGKSHDMDTNPKRNSLENLTRRNTLLLKSYLQARGLTADTVPVPQKLLKACLEARSKYSDYLKEEARKRKAEELQQECDAENKRLKLMAQTDEIQKKQLKQLSLEDKKISSKIAEAEAARIACEVKIQTAIQELQENSKVLQHLTSSKENIKTKQELAAKESLERAIQKAAEESARLKMQRDKCALAKLPKINKK